jgi:hypothetical protein
MNVIYNSYSPNETDVCVGQDTMSKGTTHIAIENSGGDDGIYIYMSDDEIQDFIIKLQISLNERKKKLNRETEPRDKDLLEHLFNIASSYYGKNEVGHYSVPKDQAEKDFIQEVLMISWELLNKDKIGESKDEEKI